MFLFFHFPTEEFAPCIEVALIGDADALCVEGGLCEVAVVGLVVGLDIGVAIRCESPLDIEVADEVGVVCQGIVAITEITVDEQTVVEQSAREYALHIEVVPALFACAEMRRPRSFRSSFLIRRLSIFLLRMEWEDTTEARLPARNCLRASAPS